MRGPADETPPPRGTMGRSESLNWPGTWPSYRSEPVRTDRSSSPEVVVIQILAVCTGNICRSPLAAKVLEQRLSDLPVSVSSAGTRARTGMPMTPQAIELAAARGAAQTALAHTARMLSEADVHNADLIIALARDHRREIVELAPTGLRNTFTAREFARLSGALSDDEVRAVARDRATGVPDDSRHRIRSVVALIARQRGISLPTALPDDDDVVDPYGRSSTTYARSAEQLDPALSAIERVLRLALG